MWMIQLNILNNLEVPYFVGTLEKRLLSVKKQELPEASCSAPEYY